MTRRRLPLAPSPDDRRSDGISRRLALQGLAGGLGLAVGLPAAAEADPHPLSAHIAERQPAQSTSDAAANAKPKFLDAHQFATLTIVSDLILPGSVESGSPSYIDEVLAIERDDVQRTFVSALAAVDAVARERHGAPFKELDRAKQVALLEEAATAGPPESTTPLPEHPDEPAPSPSAPRTITLTSPLNRLKTWIAGAHFSSEAGMKELGFTGGMFFPSFPACPHPEGHE